MRVEPEIMKTAKQITIKFLNFLGRNIYFVVALFLLHYLYTYLIFRFVPDGNLNFIVRLVFDLSFYPVIMIFILYVVSSYYAGKKVDDFQEIINQGRKYFQPLLIFYIIILLIQKIIPWQLQIITLMIMIKLAFVDQLIYYRNYSVIEAMKISCKMTTMRVFFLYFIIAIIFLSLQKTIGDYIASSGHMLAQIDLGLWLLGLTLTRFFIAISYRELIKHNFYSSMI